MEIRPAKPSDVDAILPMVQNICDLHESWDRARYETRPEVRTMYRGWLTARAEDQTSVLLYAHDGDRPAGFLVGLVQDEIPIYRLQKYGFIADLWVEVAFRNEGVGRQLVMLAIEQFARNGISQIRLETAHANEPARQLFASAGFRLSVVEMTLDVDARTSRLQ